jgi:hypothetical protein
MRLNKLSLSLVCTGLVAFAPGAFSAELAAGTVIDKSNIDKVKADTFEGKNIGGMIPEKMEWQIKNHNLKLTLQKSTPLPIDAKTIEATKKYAADVKYDAAKNEVSGYKAGIPFPAIADNDPNKAAKHMWNFYYASPVGQVMDFPKFEFLLIDGKQGLERTQRWSLYRYFHKNRTTGDAVPVDGDGKTFTRTLLFANYPQDIKGIGTFTIRHDSAQVEDQWVYIKSARRTRRLSGGAWMDPIGGTDQLNDDIEIWNARPSWYKKFNYIGKKHILAVSDAKVAWDDTKTDQAQRYPTIDLKNAPHWNPVENYQPREVHVIEAIAPDEHPYSKKVIYLEASTPRIYYGEAYDKRGDFWKWFNNTSRALKGADGSDTIISSQGHTIDFKRNHATIFVNHGTARTNTNLRAKDVDLNRLEIVAQ